MAIKRNTKVTTEFSSSSMSDLVFLLLIFFLITSTLINNNALDLLLPKSTNQVQKKPPTDVSMKYIDAETVEYYFGPKPVLLDELETLLQSDLKDNPEPTFTISPDERIAVGKVVYVMNIAKRNGYKVLLSTIPE
ncbi:MAG: biopolymer transporter ExbD [Prevotellaceae bacterium]|jgi:biopolymer transport protein ExbD|nr:biopolymer transporter ExbD [Prevotellaceae bacterium]